MSMETTNTSISPEEARRRIDEMEGAFWLGQRYARVERGTLMPDGKFETDGEHALSLAMMATAYAMKYHPELDPYRVFFYAVVHDVDEFLHGDTPTIGATKETFHSKALEEAEGAKERGRILAAFPEFNILINQLENLDVPENAYGKGFDKLAPGYSHESNNGQALKEIYSLYSYEDLLEAVSATDEKMAIYAREFADVLIMRQEMHRKVAEVAFKGPMWVDEPLFEL